MWLETQILLQTNNKGVDPPVHLRCLISVIVIHFLETVRAQRIANKNNTGTRDRTQYELHSNALVAVRAP